MEIIDVENWNRKEHFYYFTKLDNPFLGIVSEIDCTKAYQKSKEMGVSFFAYYLHKSIFAINKVDELKYRIVDGNVVKFDKIHAATTIGRSDGTFGFSFINFSPDFDIFNNELKEEIDNVKNSTGLRINENDRRSDEIHYSTLPWTKFTGLTHPRNFNTDDTVPKIVFGKTFDVDGKKVLPISIDVHHGLVDGLHVSNFLNEFQKLMNE